MHDTLLALAQSFRAQGYELYLVGGTVRDLLLHRDSPPDADLTTNARPDDIKRLVAPTHPLGVVTVGEQFGTVRLHYPRADESGQEAGSGPEMSSRSRPTAATATIQPRASQMSPSATAWRATCCGATLRSTPWRAIPSAA